MKETISEMLARIIGDSEPLETRQCISALSDAYTKAEVLAELEAVKKLEAMGVRTPIEWHDGCEVWCLPGQLDEED